MAKIKKLSDADFKTYVNANKNDFAHWVRDSLYDAELAQYLSRETSKESIIKILEAQFLLKDIPKEVKEKTIKGAKLLEENPEEDLHNIDQDKKPAAKKVYAPEGKVVQGPVKKEEILSEDEAEEVSDLLKKAIAEVEKVCIGQQEVVEKVFICLLCDSHALLEGVPGLAKTLLVETLAQVISGTKFNRIQFMPDLLPSDIIGGQMYNPKTSTFTT